LVRPTSPHRNLYPPRATNFVSLAIAPPFCLCPDRLLRVLFQSRSRFALRRYGPPVDGLSVPTDWSQQSVLPLLDVLQFFEATRKEDNISSAFKDGKRRGERKFLRRRTCAENTDEESNRKCPWSGERRRRGCSSEEIESRSSWISASRLVVGSCTKFTRVAMLEQFPAPI